MVILPYEVVLYSTVGKDYPTGQLCKVIDLVEQDYLNGCFGIDGFDFFVSKLAAYPADAVEWEPNCTAYDTDAVVIREGMLFTSLINNNTTDPLENTGDWEAWQRFTDADIQTLWDKYLSKILAYRVAAFSVEPITLLPGASGVMVLGTGRSDIGSRTGNKGEIQQTKNSLLALADMAERNMKIWLAKTENKAVADKLPQTNCGAACETSKRSRKFAFKN